MDGNNRYGTLHGMPLGEGHRAGSNQLDPVISYCEEQGIEVLSLFAFSSENWLRPEAEVNYLFALFEEAILGELPRLMRGRIRMRFTGDRARLPLRLQELMQDAEDKSAHHTGMVLNIAVSYGGQWDIVNAAKRLVHRAAKGELTAECITHDTFASELSTAGLPEVDLLIRTGGEYRISNFLLWQSAYAELYFTDCLWPEFDSQELERAFLFYNSRQRRFGSSSRPDAAVTDPNSTKGEPC